MTDDNSNYLLYQNLDHHLATLAKIYKADGKKEQLSIVVNSQVSFEGGVSYDNWNGGITGHALHFRVSESVFLATRKTHQKLASEIRDDLNKIHHVEDEFFSGVHFDLEPSDEDWRQESGVLVGRQRNVAPDASHRVWGESGYRVFLSHKSDVKKKTAELRDSLTAYGISAFVAHDSIHPTKEWQEEIENALLTMDAFVALLTKNFHESDWTDQEVGFALAKGVPVIGVKLERDPYGFLGKFQALKTTWEDAPVEIAKLLINEQRMVDFYIDGLPGCKNFEEGIALSQVLPAISKLTERQAEKMVTAFNSDSQVRGSWGFNGAKPSLYGRGLPYHLERLTGIEYVIDPSGELHRRKSK
jgi:hypothetical protein